MASLVTATLFLSGCDNSMSSPSEDATDRVKTMSEQSIDVQEKQGYENTSTADSITTGGTYTFSGAIDPINISATKDDDIEIILDNVNITSSTQPPIYINEAKDVTITLAENSNNIITDNRTTTEGTEDFPNAAIYSMSDLKITGETNSSLTVFGNLNDGITSKDDLDITEANITVSSKDDGIIGKDSVEIIKSTISVTSGGDAFKITNYETEGKGFANFETSDITISAGDDAVHAVTSIHFISGTMDIVKSYEGLESELITIDGGKISIVSDDDSINVADMGYQTEEEKAAKAARSASKLARIEQEENGNTVEQGQIQAGDRPPRGERPEGEQGDRTGGGADENTFSDGKLIINGGTLIVNSNGDGLDSNGSIFINGGEIIVEGPTHSVEGALDTDEIFQVTGGDLLATGSSGMAQAPDETSTQSVLQINFDTEQSSGTNISLIDSNGSEIFSFTPSKVFQSVVYSSAQLQQGETYSFMIDGDEFTKVTLESIVTKYGVTAGRTR